jgi:predicted ATPase
MYTFKHALIQEAAYQSLLKRTRQQYHQRIAQVVAERFPDLVETQPELLAHHYTEAGLGEQAIGYWQRAGHHARARAAYVEAISHLTKGLEVLKTVPETPERTQHELDLLLALGHPMQLAKGQASPDVEHVFAQAYALCQQLGDTPQRVAVLQGLWMVYNARAEYQTAQEFAEQALTIAQRLQDPSFLSQAHFTLGVPFYNRGELTSAHAHFEQGITFADILPPPRIGDTNNPRVWCRVFAALTLWYLGYPDRALQRSHEALTFAPQSSDHHSRFFAQFTAGNVHWMRREVHAAHERFEAALALASEQGVVLWLPVAQFRHGLVLVAQGHHEEGITQMRQGIAAMQATGVKMTLPRMLDALAEAYGHSGQAEEGLRMLAEAFAMMDETGERLNEAEQWRIKGESLLLQTVPDAPAAEACFQQALAVARRQQAKSFELRAAMSLARLWQEQDKRAAAQALLAPIYGWFTEGFDTADLQEARALLDELE